MKQRAAVVILNEEKILLLHRFSDGKEYYVCPGGSVEEGESIEEAAVREALEETGFSIKLGEKLWQYDNVEFSGRIEHFFAVIEYEGKLELGGPEASRNSQSDSYELVWLTITELKNVKFFPQEIQTKLLDKFLGNVT